MTSAISPNLIPVNIEDEMKNSYIDYAMSVIIGRALPDVRDGLKPVHRRVLFAMDELGLNWNKPYKKSARVVGEVLGKYHPHGDSAVYDTMIRMVQDFSLRYPLIDGQGNFGSVDGDSAAAMRYTEVRMSKIAHEMLTDIDKETVDFIPNFDETLFEPVVLPARIPNLLVNGSSGIAVGMATNIPPHNLSEVIDAAVHLVNNPNSTIEDLAQYILGPDFPTGAFICGRNGIRDAYRTGRGKLILRGRVSVEEQKSGKHNVIISELPYQVNKARLIEAIAGLVRDKKIEGISDLRDESDRDGMRIYIELKRDAIPEVVLNNLYKHTQLQQSFGIIMLSMVNGEPKILNLKETLSCFVDFRKEVVIKRTRYDLRKAEEKAHILEGLKTAVENIDEVVALIKKSKNPAEAREKLMKRFPLSEIQAKEILAMQLQRLTGLERDKIIDEYKATLKIIAGYRAILSSEQKVRDIVTKELLEVKEGYADDRRTEIKGDPSDINYEDLIKQEDMAVTISHTGYIKRNALSVFQSQRRGGKGKTGMTTRSEDFVEHLFIANTHDYILFFSNRGKVYWMKVHEIPELGRSAKGRAIVNLLNLSSGEKICAFVSVSEFDSEHCVTMVTSKGIIKKTTLDAFSHPRAGGIIAVKLNEEDEVVAVRITDGKKDILLAMRNGNSIRFPESNIRPTGRTTQGVKGASLSKDDRIIGMEIVDNSNSLLSVTENGYGKRTAVKEYRVQSRGGKGIITIKTTERNGKVVGVKQVNNLDNIMLIASDGKIIRLNVSEISVIGRNTQGVKLINIDEDVAKVVEVATIAHEE